MKIEFKNAWKINFLIRLIEEKNMECENYKMSRIEAVFV